MVTINEDVRRAQDVAAGYIYSPAANDTAKDELLRLFQFSLQLSEVITMHAADGPVLFIVGYFEPLKLLFQAASLFLYPLAVSLEEVILTNTPGPGQMIIF